MQFYKISNSSGRFFCTTHCIKWVGSPPIQRPPARRGSRWPLLPKCSGETSAGRPCGPESSLHKEDRSWSLPPTHITYDNGKPHHS